MKVKRYLRTILAAGLFLTALGMICCSSGLWMPNRPPESRYPVRGIDVSWHQGVIDWQAVPSGEVKFVYLKATEGGDFQDDLFKTNWEQSAKAGFRRGAYHFFTLKTPGLEQAGNFKASVPLDPLALPPAVDLEFEGNSAARPSVPDLQRELGIFIREIHSHYGKVPVLYTTQGFKEQYPRGFPPGRLWIRSVMTSPWLDAGEAWDFWQYSGKGRVKGIDGFVDLNVFRGDEKDLFLERSR